MTCKRNKNDQRKNELVIPHEEVTCINCDDFKSTPITGLSLIKKPTTNYEVELFSDRHDSRVQLPYIFEEGLSNEEFTNYTWQYNKAMGFIQRMEKEQTLVVYCSGCQPALASVIKASSDAEKNLLLKHYNACTKKYDTQVIWDNFGEIIEESIIFEKFRSNLYTYKSDITKIIKSKTGYCLSIRIHEKVQSTFGEETARIKERITILVDAEAKGWTIYPVLVSSINKEENSKGNPISIFYTRFDINSSNTDVVFDNILSKSFNYK